MYTWEYFSYGGLLISNESENKECFLQGEEAGELREELESIDCSFEREQFILDQYDLVMVDKP